MYSWHYIQGCETDSYPFQLFDFFATINQFDTSLKVKGIKRFDTLGRKLSAIYRPLAWGFRPPFRPGWPWHGLTPKGELPPVPYLPFGVALLH